MVATIQTKDKNQTKAAATHHNIFVLPPVLLPITGPNRKRT